MGIYQRLIPNQACVLCGESAKFCVCEQCELSLQTHQHRCRCCAIKLEVDLDFCGQCLRHTPYFSKSWTLYEYSGSCAQLIKAFKFNHQLCIGAYFAHKLDTLFALITEHHDYDVIIPMPLSNARIKERGYNQTHELLKIIKKNPSVIIDINSVERIKSTRAFFTLSPTERKIEIKNAFKALPMSYQKVLLVDDVMTTTASLNELAKTVIRAGVGCCDVMTLART